MTATDHREELGRLAREVWVDWAREQPDAKPSWLLGWDELDGGQREVDMRIGEAVGRYVRGQVADPGPSFPWRGPCTACGAPLLIAETRHDPGYGIILDAEPDGDGPSFCIVLSGDQSRVTGSVEGHEEDCRGRLPLYRQHVRSCPDRSGFYRCYHGLMAREIDGD